MKNSTKLLGIFLVSILIISLIFLFVVKAYLDSKSGVKFPSVIINKNLFSNGENLFNDKLKFKTDISDLSNLTSIENKFFNQADEFITNNTQFKLKDKTEYQVNSLNNINKININLTKGICIFSDKATPKISYKLYTNDLSIKNPVQIINNKIGILDESFSKNYKINDDIYLFVFMILPTKYENLDFDINISNIQIWADNLDVSKIFKLNQNASSIDANLLKVKALNGQIEISASDSYINSELMIFEETLSIKINASKSQIKSKLIKSKNLVFDFNASDSLIDAYDFNISSEINIKENAGKYIVNCERFLSFPSIFTYKANMTDSSFTVKNCKDFYVKSKLNAGNISIKYNGEIHKFSGGFELSSNKNKSDAKNLLNINLDVNMGNLNLNFE